jgi:hypothetical protein
MPHPPDGTPLSRAESAASDAGTSKPALDPSRSSRRTGAILRQAEKYRNAAHKSSRGHYKAADGLEAWHGRIGAPAALLSAIVATSIFATLAEDPGRAWRIATALISLAAAALASLQLFFNYTERSTQHRASAAAYASLRRELDLLLIRAEDSELPSPATRTNLLEALERVRIRFDELADSSPLIPDRAWKRAMKEIDQEGNHAALPDGG